MINLLMLNTLNPIDIVFFIVCAVIIAAVVGVYFLIPVINKKQYQEQRENLKKREEAFKSNLTVDPTENNEPVQTSPIEDENKKSK